MEQLKSEASGCEVIVVDGGSIDSTASIAEEYFTVIKSSPGRAVQMNSGAAAATGDVLWFLHVDSILPESAVAEIQSLMHNGIVAIGCFRLCLPARGLAYRICDDLGNLAVELTGLTCGDHGIFARREVFNRIGGYPDMPIMEDLALSRRLKKFGKLVQLRSRIITAPRKWQKNGPWLTTGVYLLLISLYLVGTPIHTLHNIYKRLK